MSSYLLIGLVAAAVTLLTAPGFRALAECMGIVAHVRERDIHVHPVPYLGGIPIYLGLWAGLLVAENVPLRDLSTTGLDDARHVLAAAGIVFGYGLADDFWDLPALGKLGAQVATGGLLAAWEVRLFTLPLPGGYQLSISDAQSAIFTVLIVVLSSNAVNLVDGLDGLAAGVVFAGAGGLLIFTGLSQNRFTTFGGATLIAVLLMGVCLGFYVHNAPPAKMFMGDAGSLPSGVLLSSAAILAVQFAPTTAAPPNTIGFDSRLGIFLWLALPVCILGIPLLDLSLALIRRLASGQPLFKPDKRHLHHLLVGQGNSHAKASWILTCWSITVAWGAAWIVVAPSVLKLVAVFAVAFALLTLSELTRRSTLTAAERSGELSDDAFSEG